jgi:hypothetical protein
MFSSPIRALVLLALSSAWASACGMTSEARSSTTQATPPPCPSDLESAVGSPCASAGQICSPGGPAPDRMIECAAGTWSELNVPPGPTPVTPPPAEGAPAPPSPAP